jgi:hypothetical protein
MPMLMMPCSSFSYSNTKGVTSSNKLRKYRRSATSSSPKKDRLQKIRGRGPADLENSTIYFPDERIDTRRKEERGWEKASCSFRSSALKGERNKDHHDHRTILPQCPLHREGGVAPRLRRRADCARRRTTSAGIPPTEKPAPKHSATPRGRRTGSGTTCFAG